MTTFFFDSMQKIVETYFSAVITRSFEYKGKTYHPKKEVHVSPGIFRGTTCPPMCGGCCRQFHLIWLPDDPMPDTPELTVEMVTVKTDKYPLGRTRPIVTDRQVGNTDYYCKNLDKTTGRCGIHTVHPFSCDFELIRFTHREDRVDISTKIFGRGWSYTRVTGQKGNMCDLTPSSEKNRDDAVRKLTNLKKWTDYWSLSTNLPRIIEWVASGPHDEPLHIVNDRTTLFDFIHD